MADEIAIRQRHDNLVALPDIAHEGEAPFGERRAAGSGGDDVLRLLAHLVKEAVGGIEVEIREPHIAATHYLEGDRRAQEADRRADASIGRYDDARDAEFFREARHMERRRTAEGDERIVGDGFATLDRMDARCVRHVLVDDLRDAVGVADPGADCGRGLAGVERNAAAGEIDRIDPAEDHIGIGYSGFLATAPIAGWAGLGARAFRPDGDAA